MSTPTDAPPPDDKRLSPDPQLSATAAAGNVRLLDRFRRRFEPALDILWPTITPPTPDEVEQTNKKQAERVAAELQAIDDAGAIKMAALRATRSIEILMASRELLDRERQRRAGIESRLTTILGFIALAATIAMAVLGSRLDKGDGQASGWQTIVTTIIIAYMVVQLVRAAVAAVAGLARTSLLELEAEDLFPGGEPHGGRERRIAKELVSCIEDHDDANKQKVNQLALAHVAIKNFLRALIVLMMLSASAIVWNSLFPLDRTQALIDALRADPALIRELRGSQGVPGNEGPPGPTGPAGPMGPPGEPCTCTDTGF